MTATKQNPLDWLVTLQVDKPAVKTKALAIPATGNGITVDTNLAETRYAEYAAQGSTETDKAAADAYYRLSQGDTLISLAESMTNSVLTDRAGNRMARLGIARADATQVVGLYHPNGSWELKPNKGPRWSFRDIYEPHSGFRAKEIITAPPALGPSRRGSASTKFIIWSADWRMASAPPGTVLLAEQVTPNLYAIVDKWDYTEADSFVLGGVRK